MEQSVLRIAAVSDIHYSRHTQGKFNDVFEHASSEADVFCICGDLTDYGLPEEAAVLASDLRAHLRIPVLAVLGNHDFESGMHNEVADVMEEAGVTVLDGACSEIGGVGFAGISGFGGGFGERMLNGWGERTIKDFVQAAVDEELKLETRGATALFANQGDRAGGIAGDLSISRFEQAGGAAQSVSRSRGYARTRTQWISRRKNRHGNPRLQRLNQRP